MKDSKWFCDGDQRSAAARCRRNSEWVRRFAALAVFLCMAVLPGGPVRAEVTGPVDAGSDAAITDPTFNGGTLNVTNDFPIAKNLTLNAGGGIFQTNGYTLSVFGSISGIGGLTKDGTGTLTLSGANTYSGGTTVAGGTLSVGAGVSLGTGTLSFTGGTLAVTGDTAIGNNAHLIANATLDTSAAVTLSGVISGSGGLIKTGVGTLTLSGTNTYSGGTTVSAGTLVVGSTGAFGSGSLTVAGGATANLNGYNMAVGSLNGGGTIALGNGTLTVGNSTNSTFNGAISGTGSLVKTGSGTLALAGANTYTGTTTVSAGTLSINGSIGGPVTVGASGTLKGTGRTGSVTNSGTIAPGNAGIGTLTIIGDYHSDAGSVYQVNLNAAGQSDCLMISGSAYVNGTISLLAESGNYAPSTTYTILDAGSLYASGLTFTTNFAFLTPTYITGGSKIQVKLTRNSTSFTDVASSANQQRIATALDAIRPSASGDMSTVINSVTGLSAGGARAAFDRMGGYAHMALNQAAASSANRYTDTVANRMNGFVQGGPSLATSGLSMAGSVDTGSRAGNMLLAAVGKLDMGKKPEWGLWMRGYGGKGDRSGDGVSSRYDFNSDGVTIGFDRPLSDKLLVGVATGYSTTRTTMSDLGDSGKTKGVYESLYGTWLNGPWYVNAILTYSGNHYDTTRNVNVGAISRTANASYGGYCLSGYAETGYRIRRDSLTIIPMVSIQSSYLSHDAFTETGADSLNLSVGKAQTSSLTGSLGVRIRKDTELAKGTLNQELTLRWLHDFRSLGNSMDVAFIGSPGATFTVSGDTMPRDRTNIGYSVAWQAQKNKQYFFSYDANLAHGATDQWVSLGLRYTW